MGRKGGSAPVMVVVAVAAVGLWPSTVLAQRSPAAPLPAPKFEWIEDSPYLVLNWNCNKGDGRSLVVEGLAEVPFRTASNIYHGELTLVGLDGKGNRVSKATGYLPPVLHMNYSAPFTVSLALTGSEARVDLHYAFDFSTNRGGQTDPQRFNRVEPRLVPAAAGQYQWYVTGACPIS